MNSDRPKHETPPSQSIHSLSDLSRNFQVRFKKLKSLGLVIVRNAATTSRVSLFLSLKGKQWRLKQPPRDTVLSFGVVGLEGVSCLESRSNKTFHLFPSFHENSFKIWGKMACQLLDVLSRQHILWTFILFFKQRGNVCFELSLPLLLKRSHFSITWWFTIRCQNLTPVLRLLVSFVSLVRSECH